MKVFFFHTSCLEQIIDKTQKILAKKVRKIRFSKWAAENPLTPFQVGAKIKLVSLIFLSLNRQASCPFILQLMSELISDDQHRNSYDRLAINSSSSDETSHYHNSKLNSESHCNSQIRA